MKCGYRNMASRNLLYNLYDHRRDKGNIDYAYPRKGVVKT